MVDFKTSKVILAADHAAVPAAMISVPWIDPMELPK
jgi:hypothetical protein